MVEQTQRKAPSTFGQNYLKNPAVAAALLQFGLDIGQPSPGGFMSQLTRAIGGGAAAAGRYGKAQADERAAETKRFDMLNQQNVEQQYKQSQLAEAQRENRSQQNYREAALQLDKKRLGLQEMINKQRGAGGAKGSTEAQRQSRYLSTLKLLAEDARDATMDPTIDILQFMEDPELQRKAWALSQTGPQDASPQAFATVPAQESGVTASPAPTPTQVSPSPEVVAPPTPGGFKSNYLTGGKPQVTQTAPVTAPAAPTTAPKLPPGMTVEAVLAEARTAISQGKNRAMILQRLQQMGIPTEGL